MQRRKSVIPPEMVEGLQGSLATTSIVDLLQFLNASGKTGELLVTQPAEGREARVYLVKGNLVHVVSGNVAGMEALVMILGWISGTFHFYESVLSPKNTMLLPTQQALMEAIRILDERAKHEQLGHKATSERSNDMAQSPRTSTDVLEELLKVPGVTAAVVVGRDGFVIESAGGGTAISLDDLGAALANAINGIEEMGSELKVAKFQDLFVEYGRAVIMCRPIGDAIIAVTAPDASKLGIIRHKAKPLIDDLASFF
jgi:predicted regulator of Ras-like GTPase activity (Roadblock/LC7/MglB family)